MGGDLGSQPGGDPAPAEPPSPSEEAAPAAEADGAAGQDFSTTNIQEPGVDEPDIVKTNGRYLYTVVGGKLHVIDARAAQASLLSSTELPLGWEHEIFLRGNRVIVLTRSSQTFPDPELASDSPRYSFAGVTTLTSISVRKPAAPRIVESYSIEGSYLSTRLIGDTLRVVTTTPSPLGLEFVFPTDSSEATETEALKTNRREIAAQSRARLATALHAHRSPHYEELGRTGRPVSPDPSPGQLRGARHRDDPHIRPD